MSLALDAELAPEEAGGSGVQTLDRGADAMARGHTTRRRARETQKNLWGTCSVLREEKPCALPIVL